MTLGVGDELDSFKVIVVAVELSAAVVVAVTSGNIAITP